MAKVGNEDYFVCPLIRGPMSKGIFLVRGDAYMLNVFERLVAVIVFSSGDCFYVVVMIISGREINDCAYRWSFNHG